MPLRLVADSALDARRRISSWLARSGSESISFTQPYVYVCRDLRTLHTVRRHHEIAAFGIEQNHSFESEGTFTPRGGYYAQLGIIALVAGRNQDLRLDIVHEMTHVVLEKYFGVLEDVIDEGLAEVLSPWILFTESTSPRQTPITNINHANQCSTTLADGQLPNLRTLFLLDYWQFRDKQSDNLYFALSWSLVDFLLRTDDPRFANLFPKFLNRARSLGSAWRALAEVYDIRTLWSAWHNHLVEFSQLHWHTKWGQWYMLGDRIVGSLRTPGLAMCIYQQSLEPPFDVSFRLPRGLTSRQSAGCVLGHGLDAYYAVQIRFGGREINLSQYRGGQWAGNHPAIQIDSGVTLSDRSIVVRCKPSGEILVSLSGEVLARFLAAPDSLSGRTGLIMELRQEDDQEFSRGDVLFESVRIKRLQ